MRVAKLLIKISSALFKLALRKVLWFTILCIFFLVFSPVLILFPVEIDEFKELVSIFLEKKLSHSLARLLLFHFIDRIFFLF